MGHWLVTLCLCVKPDFSCVTINLKMVPPTSLFSCKSELFSYERFCTDSFWNRSTRWFRNDVFWLRINVTTLFWLNGAGDDFTTMYHKAIAPVAYLDLTDNSRLTESDFALHLITYLPNAFHHPTSRPQCNNRFYTLWKSVKKSYLNTLQPIL